MTKTLTEQWREGKLPDGAYYILVDKYEQNEPEIDVGICYNSNFEWWIVKEVLAPVPSYDEYKELVSKTEQLEKKLEIATKALKEYADEDAWGIDETDPFYPRDVFVGKGFEIAHKALKEMEGVK